MTYTYAALDVSPATYAEIQQKLKAAGYQHAFHQDREGEVIDMHGIALRESRSATARILLGQENPPRVMDVALEEDRRRQEDADRRYQQQQAQ